MKTILITAGPVHEHLDEVKIITNRFKGGRIAGLAVRIIEEGLPAVLSKIDGDELLNDPCPRYKVIYLCSKDSALPKCDNVYFGHEVLKIVYHSGFNDYYKKVKELCKQVDAVILGAAVCNLIPVSPIKGKFPSHNYKPNDIIPINFKIAPRVVDMVKKENPKVALFAFKLLSGVEHGELIDAAYDIALESHATAVIANDLSDLDKKYIITKEKGVLPRSEDDYHTVILNLIENEYYKTFVCGQFFDRSEMNNAHEYSKALNDLTDDLKYIYEKNKEKFEKTYGKEKFVFGTICGINREFGIQLATLRGKKGIDVWEPFKVCHVTRKVFVKDNKVTLNAPLIDNIFRTFWNVNYVVHYHDFVEGLPCLPYALPGTERDTARYFPLGCEKGFNILGHGAFIFMRSKDE